MDSKDLKLTADACLPKAVALAQVIISAIREMYPDLIGHRGFRLSDYVQGYLKSQTMAGFIGSGATSSVWELAAGCPVVLRVQHATGNERTRDFFKGMVGRRIPHLPEVFAHFVIDGHDCFIVRRYESLGFENACSVADGLQYALMRKKYGSAQIPGKLVRAYRKALELAKVVEGRFTREKLGFCNGDAHAGNIMRDPDNGRLVIIDPVY